jgi:hypothetical protein
VQQIINPTLNRDPVEPLCTYELFGGKKLKMNLRAAVLLLQNGNGQANYLNRIKARNMTVQ